MELEIDGAIDGGIDKGIDGWRYRWMIGGGVGWREIKQYGGIKRGGSHN